MGKRTKKVGIVGKYATRYGASLRKMVKKIEISQHDTYECAFCGKKTVKRTCVGIWKCKHCCKTIAGGAWAPTTGAALTARHNIQRLRKLMQTGASQTTEATPQAQPQAAAKK
ncbi:unnamed protein product [Blepharisma stoltei]|uniref:60S ribosomal protein L37a n=1 Tax=Blepharisma stoltei TaxID=1481888 RepID=A0AAU9JG22_9CILI|nr:unnamed protein product [Blepharisma stoltei]